MSKKKFLQNYCKKFYVIPFRVVIKKKSELKVYLYLGGVFSQKSYQISVHKKNEEINFGWQFNFPQIFKIIRSIILMKSPFFGMFFMSTD